MENFKFESRYLKLCYEFRDFMRCTMAAFYRPDYLKFLMYLLIKRLCRGNFLKHAAESLKRSAELMKHSAKHLSHSAELLTL